MLEQLQMAALIMLTVKQPSWGPVKRGVLSPHSAAGAPAAATHVAALPWTACKVGTSICPGDVHLAGSG